MTKASLIKKTTTFNWGWLTGSEVQSIIINVTVWQHPGRHSAGRAEQMKSSEFTQLNPSQQSVLREHFITTVPQLKSSESTPDPSQQSVLREPL